MKIFEQEDYFSTFSFSDNPKIWEGQLGSSFFKIPPNCPPEIFAVSQTVAW